MKVIIAGGRDINLHPNEVAQIINQSGFGVDIETVVSGGAAGIDNAGEFWAQCHPEYVHVERFPAKWGEHGKAAGPIRNKQMAEYADALILIWDGKSRGSANMLKQAENAGLKIHQHIKN